MDVEEYVGVCVCVCVCVCVRARKYARLHKCRTICSLPFDIFCMLSGLMWSKAPEGFVWRKCVGFP